MTGNLSVYSVGPPTAAINAPSNGAIFTEGESVATSFGCADAPCAPGLFSCVDSDGNPTPSGRLDTSAIGAHSYTVAATSEDGQTSSTSISYTVIAPPAPPVVTEVFAPPVTSVSQVSQSGRADSLTLACQGQPGQQCAGSVTASTLEREQGGSPLGVTARRHRKSHKPPVTTVTVTVAAASFTIAAGHSANVSLALNAAGSRLLAKFYVLPTALSFSGTRNASPRTTIRFAYSLVTPPNGVSASFSWVGEPCAFCWTKVDPSHVFGISNLLPTATVKVRCNGVGCPRSRSFGPGRSSVNLDAMFAGHRMGQGSVIQLFIKAPNSVGRLVTFRMRPALSPTERVLCLPPGARKPLACATGA
jgi:hypothetical protein